MNPCAHLFFADADADADADAVADADADAGWHNALITDARWHRSEGLIYANLRREGTD